MNALGRIIIWTVTAVSFATAAFAAQGVAEIKGTSPDSKITGTVKFLEVDGGLKVEAQVQGVAPTGKHGFHIHEFGVCTNQGKDAGGHYNPMSSPHGMLEHDGTDKAHAGDLGNIEIKEDGTGTLSGMLPGVTLSGGDQSVGGRAVILHEKEDDFGQPTGNAGGRIGCGVIVLTPDE